MKKLKFFVITDTHYYKNSLGAYGNEYEEYMKTQQKCFAETQAINEAVFSYLEASNEADIVIFPGDLTFNGEKECHEDFVKLLKKLKNAGKKVYVLTASHDYDNNAFAYNGGAKKSLECASFDDLYDYYREFGYDDAIEFNKEHLSYVAQLDKNVRLLVLCNDTPNKKSVAYSDEFLKWIEKQAQQAIKDNQIMIAMEHYPVLAGQPILELIDDARQKESEKLIDTLANNGVHLIFTGHMHNQSINCKKTYKGNILYDVCTGSIIGWPSYMRLVTIKDNSTVEIESIEIPEYDWDTGSLSCRDYLIELFDRMIKNVGYQMEHEPIKFLNKIHLKSKNKIILKLTSKAGKKINNSSVNQIAKTLHINVDSSLKNKKFIDLMIDYVRSVFVGDQPHIEGTPTGDFMLSILKRMKPILNLINKKLKGSQGEEIDLYTMIKHSIGNYGISDYNSTLNF